MRAHLALASLVLLTACPRLDPMQRQQKVRPYEASPYYPDGRAMRDPPAGTVPYASLADPAFATGLGADGKPLARIPVELTADLLALGRRSFDVTCAACHGVLGDGESQVALNMSLRKPPSLHQFRDLADGTIYRVVSEGFGLMPSYSGSLSARERWAVVAYVRALQLSQAASLGDVPPDVREGLEREAR